MADKKRIQRELKEVKKDEALSGVTVETIDSNLKHLKGTISGPKDSPYEGGLFLVDIVMPDDYPFEPPKMKFISKVWHPNVSSQNGAICLDILKNQWSPALTLKSALISLQALLSSPEPDDPQDAVVAKQYLSDYPTFVRTARHWTETFASQSVVSLSEKVSRLVDMGFEESDAKKALQRCDGDESAALELLFSSGNEPIMDEYVDDGVYSEQVKRLVGMGFDAHAARRALEASRGDEASALDKLLNTS